MQQFEKRYVLKTLDDLMKGEGVTDERLAVSRMYVGRAKLDAQLDIGDVLPECPPEVGTRTTNEVK